MSGQSAHLGYPTHQPPYDSQRTSQYPPTPGHHLADSHHMPMAAGGVSPGGIADHGLYRRDQNGYSMSDRYSGQPGASTGNAIPYHSSYSMYEDGPNIFDRQGHNVVPAPPGQPVDMGLTPSNSRYAPFQSGAPHFPLGGRNGLNERPEPYYAMPDLDHNEEYDYMTGRNERSDPMAEMQ